MFRSIHPSIAYVVNKVATFSQGDNNILIMLFIRREAELTSFEIVIYAEDFDD
jgi:hypothetical protein